MLYITCMGVSVKKNYFNGLRGALEDIARDEFWPTTFISEPSAPPDVHWHACDVHGYVISGNSTILDGETGQWLSLSAGDKLIIPAGALHIEGESESTVVYVVATRDQLPFKEVFQLLPADDPQRPR